MLANTIPVCLRDRYCCCCLINALIILIWLSASWEYASTCSRPLLSGYIPSARRMGWTEPRTSPWLQSPVLFHVLLTGAVFASARQCKSMSPMKNCIFSGCPTYRPHGRFTSDPTSLWFLSCNYLVMSYVVGKLKCHNRQFFFQVPGFEWTV